MAMEIFKLVGSIFVDSDQAEQSISKADKKAGNFGETLASGVKTAAKWGAAIVAGASTAVTGVTAFANKAASAADEIDKMSQKIGLSREAYQEMDFILSQNGMDVNQLQNGMKTLTNQLYAAAQGTQGAVGYFDELGISIADSSGQMRDTEDVFFEAIGVLQNMDDETERAALANKLFGRSATEMAPLLNAGAGSMEELRQKAHDLGLVLDDDVIDSGVALTDTMDQLKRSAEAIGNRLGGVLMPMVQNVASYILDAMPQIESVIYRFAPILENIFTSLVPLLMVLAEQIFPQIADLLTALMPSITTIIQAILPIIVQLMERLLPAIAQIVGQLLPPLVELLLPLLALLNPIMQVLSPILDLVLLLLPILVELLSSILPPIVAVVKDIVQVLLEKLGPVMEKVSGVIHNVFVKAFEDIKPVIATIEPILKGLLTFITSVFTGDWKKAWTAVKDIFSGIWSSIKEAFKVPINWIVGGINKFIGGINKIKIPDWVPGVGGKGFNIDPIPTLAEGGILERGQVGLLEGTGAEAVVPLERNRKWTQAVAEQMDSAIGSGSSSRIEAILYDILEAVVRLLDLGIYLDGDQLVGGLARRMDKALGRIQAQKARA